MYNQFGKQALCVTCRQKSLSMFEEQLKRIERMLNNIEPNNNYPQFSFNWGISHRCKFNMPCDRMNQFQRNSERIADRITPKVITVCLGDDFALYKNLLNLLRGYFPAVHQEASYIWTTKKVYH